jgi:two-component SAPR family response regulator
VCLCRCYQYYLDKVDRGDTSILTRLGNLLVREHQHQEAVEVYRKTLSVDSSLSNVWFNLANSLRSIGDEAGKQIRLDMS